MRAILLWFTVVVLSAGLCAQSSAPDPQTKKKMKKKEMHSATEELAGEVLQLRQMMEAQQRQIQQLQQEVRSRDQEITELQNATNQARSSAESAVSSSSQSAQAVSALQTTVADIKLNTTNMASTMQEEQKQVGQFSKLSDLAHGKIKIGATFYGNFTHYTDAGFSPAFQDLPTTQLKPGDSGLNVFEVTRAYVNLFYTPDERVTLRITPDIYRSADSSLAFRLKYAFVDFQKIFGDGAFKKDKITFGQTQQGLTDWEEGLSGYRYAYLTPWNYLSLSSTYVGAKIHGPIEMNGKEYLDYDLGVFTTASFHATETNDKKQFMGRLTFYPFGTTSDRTGLGLTVFENYGYNTKTPSQVSTSLNRLSVLAHYQTHNKAYQVAFEYQLGRNAVSTGNLFGGAGSPAGGPYDAFNTLAGTVLSGTHTRQQGYDVFGHARLGHSPFSVWGLFQYFQPNTNFTGTNPLDFERTVGGISYKVTRHFDVAFGDQNFHWLHPSLGADHGPDTNGIVIWTQFNY
jgi:hypothetical protein